MAAVRPAVAADLPACAALAPTVRTFALDLEDDRRQLLVAEIDEAVVGYARAHYLEPGPDAPADHVPAGYYLVGLFVVPAHRRAGLGHALTSARLDWIGERADEAWYFTNARNTASIELHRRFGFTEVTRAFSFPDLVFDGGEGILFRSAVGLHWPTPAAR